MSGDFPNRGPRWARSPLGLRLLLIVSGVAALSTGLALALQDRVLANDLRSAAIGRADRAAEAVGVLVASHLDALAERYRAISRTPALRATLELGDAPTLRFYADSLRERERADAIVVLDRSGQVSATVGDAHLAELAREAKPLDLIELDRMAYAVVSVPLDTAGVEIGRLIAAERLPESTLTTWSHLSGADVALGRRDEQRNDEVVVRSARALATIDLLVAIPFREEHQALANSRRNLLVAGGGALAIAFAVSLLVARSITRPIRDIQAAAGRIGHGEFATRIASRRSDEIGDVARAVDDMGERLGEYRSQVEGQTRELERSISELEESKQQLANAQRLARMGSWTLDPSSGEVFGSEEFRALFGLPNDHKPIDAAWVRDLIHPEDRADVTRAFQACMDGAAAMRIDCRTSLPDRSERVMHVQARLQPARAGRTAIVEGTVQDVTERHRADEQIRFLRHHDPLTGLGNRHLLRERLEIQLEQCRRAGVKVGVIQVDLDRFKRINDTFGPSVGDRLLQDVADRIVATVASNEAPGRADEPGAVFRLGADEYTVVLRASPQQPGFALLARRLVEALSAPFTLEGHEVVVGASAGISVFPDDGGNVEELLQNATAALHHAKEERGHNVQFFAGRMNEVALKRITIENDLRRAIEAEEFELFYQPKICLATAQITGAEALLRWRGADGQMISPADFIPIAEESGLISEIGTWVTRTACRQIAAWHRDGLGVPISVNVSIHQFREQDFAASVERILGETGAPPGLLELEITESTLMHDEREIVRDLERLRAGGSFVSLDDFGTGYSSFAHLQRLPVDTIKIDRSFVMNIEEDANAAALLASIVFMGHALGLEVVAEGVETTGQRDLLAQSGCDVMQGFLVSPAVEPDAFRAIVGKRGWAPRRQPANGDH